MGRLSTKQNKNIYQETREKMMSDGKPWSREKAADEMAKIENGRFNYLNEDKLVKIESESIKIQPEDVLGLSIAYNTPELRNYYCCHQCPIGEKDAPEVVYKDNIYEILVNMSVSLEAANSKKMRLMEILSDGTVDMTEVGDLNKILEELEKISMTVEAIQLWCEKMKLLGTNNN